MWWITIRSIHYRQQAEDCWSRWFAWHPVTVKILPDGAHKKIWLSTVERRIQKKIFPFTSEWIHREVE